MAKTAPLKNKKAPSKHSRAEKRASSPSINTDKSLKELKPPIELKGPVLAAHTASGVKKSKGRKTVLSSKARKRREKNLDRAEAVLDRTQTKVQKSKDKARNVQDRSKAWDELNRKELAAKKANAAEEETWEDMGEEVEDEIDMDDVALVAPAPIDSTILVELSDRMEDANLIL